MGAKIADKFQTHTEIPHVKYYRKNHINFGDIELGQEASVPKSERKPDFLNFFYILFLREKTFHIALSDGILRALCGKKDFDLRPQNLIYFFKTLKKNIFKHKINEITFHNVA